MKQVFADSYAILSFFGGDEGYADRLRRTRFRTGTLNLLEIHYAQISRGVPAAEANARLAPFEQHAETPDWPTLREASAFRNDMRSRGRKCSYIDAIGYSMAKGQGIPFLTGDPAFDGLQGVEFLREGTQPPPRPSRRAPRRRPLARR